VLNLTGNSKQRRKTTIRQNATTGGISRNTKPVNMSPSQAFEVLNYGYVGEDVLGSLRDAQMISGGYSADKFQDMIELNDVVYYSFKSGSNTKIRKIESASDDFVVTLGANRNIKFSKYADFVYFVSGLGNENVSAIYSKGQFMEVASVANYQVNYTVENASGGKAIVDYVDTDLNVLVIQPPFEGSFSNGDTVSQPAISSTTTTMTDDILNVYELPNAPSGDFIETMTSEGDSRIVVFNTQQYGKGSSLRSHTDKNFGIPFDDFSFTAGAEAPDEGGLTVSSDLAEVAAVDYYGNSVYQINKNGMVLWGIGLRNVDGIGLLQNVITRHEERNTDEFYDCVATKYGLYYVSKSGIFAFTLKDGVPEHIDISDSIKLLWETLVFDESTIVLFDKKLYIMCKKNSASSNNYILIYDLEKRRWTSMDGSYDRLYASSTTLYGMDHSNDRIVEVFGGAGYLQTNVTFREEDLGLPRNSKSVREISIENLLGDTDTATLLITGWDDNNVSGTLINKTLTGTSDTDISTFDYQSNSKPVRKFQIKYSADQEEYNEFHSLDVDVEIYDKIYKNNI